MELLRRNAAFRRLWLARTISFLGDSLGLLALILYIADTEDSSAAVGLLLLAGDFTPSLLAPVLGVIADRTEPRRTMIGCELGQGVAVGLIVVLQPAVPIVLVLVAVRSLLAATFQATSRSAITELVEDADLERANALLGFGTHGLDAIGPLLAAALLLVLEPRGVLAVDVATFLVSPLPLVLLPRITPVEVTHDSLFAEARVGLGVIWSHRPVRTIALGFFAVAAFTAVDDVALVFLGKDTFAAGDSGVSLLYAGGGVGLLVGFALLARRSGPAARLTIIGFALACGGNLLTGLSPAIAIAIGMQAVRGAGNSLIDVGTSTLIQREVPREVRGRVFANLFGGVGVAAATSYVVGGALVDVLGPRTVLVGAGAGGMVATVAVALAVARE